MYSFFAVALKFAKRAFLSKTYSFLKLSICVWKNAEFYDDFKFVDADLKKGSEKSCSQKTLRILSIFVSAHFSVVFFLSFLLKLF
jgi:hypothetical protein